jgi:hypothetical protein
MATLDLHTLRVLHAVRDAYGGDPKDRDWNTPEGIARIIEDLSGMVRATAAHAAMIAVERDPWREAAHVLHAALAEVMRDDDRHTPCDHPHDADNGCTHCHARALVARHDREAA